MSGLAEEAPVAYKDVSRVVEVVHRVGIGKKVDRLEPIAVIKVASQGFRKVEFGDEGKRSTILPLANYFWRPP
jgi:hypothetical protein